MEKASRVMYTIANIFNWVLVLLCGAGIVLSALAMAHIMKSTDAYGSTKLLVYYIITLIVALVEISLVRVAKGKNTSKGWDILFIVLGVLGSNIFYILGGIFGVIAVRR